MSISLCVDILRVFGNPQRAIKSLLNPELKIIPPQWVVLPSLHIGDGNTTTVGSITIPYVQGVSEGLSHIIRKVGIIVHIKPTNAIRSMLVAPKDKPHKGDRSCMIYGHQCKTCSSHYVGETERPLKKSLAEHRPPSRPTSNLKDMSLIPRM